MSSGVPAEGGPPATRGPLAGIRILDFSTALAGPLATGMLGDLGAEVVKLEPTGFGDVLRYIGPSVGGVSGPYLAANRSKRAGSVDLKTPEGLEIALEFAKTADVVFQNFRPGVADRLGIGYQHLCEIKPDTILVAISGYGPTGPWAQRPAYDGVIQGLSGMAMIEADPETHKPHNLRHTASDKLAALYASQAALAALAARDRGQDGQLVHVPLLNSSVAFMWVDGDGREALMDYDGPQAGNPGRYVTPTQCADGWIYIVAAMPAQFRSLCEAMGVAPKVNAGETDAAGKNASDASNASAMGLSEKLWQRINEKLAQMSVAEACACLEAHDVPAGPATWLKDVPSLEQLSATNYFVKDNHPVAGKILQTRHPASFEGTPAALSTQAPEHGRDTRELLEEIGRSDYEALKAKGAVE